MTRFILLLGFVLVAAAPGVANAVPDPPGDVATCPGMRAGGGGEAPDLVAAAGDVVELGTSIRWTLRFARPLTVPDDEGKPFRVDVLVYDSTVPKVSLGYYHGLNRLLRYDAVADPVLHTLLLPELGESRFLPPLVDGDTMTIRVPGRTLTADEEGTGTSPGLEHLRWSVIVRDGTTCDLLGDGRPTHPLRVLEAAPPTHAPPASSTVSSDDRSRLWPFAAGALLVLVGIGVALALWRRAATRRP